MSKYGVGRLPVLVTLHELDEQALVDILTIPRNALVRQYTRLFEMEKVKLSFSEGALRAISHLAMDRGTGARGLRSILESVMLDIMYELPSQDNIKEVVLSEETITAGEQPIIVYGIDTPASDSSPAEIA